MCKSIGKTPLYYESSTEKHKSSSACCIKLHEVCCRWIVSVNFLVKVFHSAMKQGKIMNFLSLIGKSKTYHKSNSERGFWKVYCLWLPLS